jgi:hypothetical protein
MSAAIEFIHRLTGDLQSLSDLAERLGDSSQVDVPNGVFLAHRPAVAPEAYALRLYRPLPKDALDRYLARTKLRVPDTYLELLSRLNGAHAFQLALFGIPPSLTFDPPMMDRSAPQPYDLATANEHWKREFRESAELFYFGGSPFSDDQNVGYFLSSGGSVRGVLKSGQEVGKWSSIGECLRVELARAESEYPRFEAFMSSLQAASRARGKSNGDA